MNVPHTLKVVDFTNRSGSLSHRVVGKYPVHPKYAPKGRVRKNFNDFFEAQEYLKLLKDRLSQSEVRVVTTRLTEAEALDAEGALVKLRNAGASTSLTQAVDFFLERFTPITDKNALDALDEFNEYKEKVEHTKEITVKTSSAVVKKYLVDYEVKMLSGANLDDIKEYASATGNPRTLKKRRDRISEFFNWCVDRSYMGENICLSWKLPKNINKKDSRKTPAILSLPQLQLFLEKALEYDGTGEGKIAKFKKGVMLPYCAVASLSAARPEEVRRIDSWDLFDFEQDLFPVFGDNSKTVSRWVPICINLKKILLHCRDELKVEPGFYSRRALNKIREASGLDFDWTLEAQDILRHTYASYRYALEKNLNKLSEEMANSPGVLKRHYVVPLKESQGKAFEEMIISK